MDGDDNAVLTFCVIYPDLLGTYGDGGNAVVLVARARARGIEARIVDVTIGQEIPDASLYLLGGGEDGPQRLACDLLAEGGLADRVRDGAFVFAVCAGLQILGTSFSIEGDATYPGLALVDASTARGASRSVGDIATTVGDHTMVGFENHGGIKTDLIRFGCGRRRPSTKSRSSPPTTDYAAPALEKGLDILELLCDQGAGFGALISLGAFMAIDALIHPPATLLTAALYSRFASQGAALFADKVQSAQRKEFGGHQEKTG